MTVIAIIGCIVGIISCVIGISTFISALLSKARSDGRTFEKTEQIYVLVQEIKADVKERNTKTDTILEEVTKDVVELKTQMKDVRKVLELS